MVKPTISHCGLSIIRLAVFQMLLLVTVAVGQEQTENSFYANSSSPQNQAKDKQSRTIEPSIPASVGQEGKEALGNPAVAVPAGESSVGKVAAVEKQTISRPDSSLESRKLGEAAGKRGEKQSGKTKLNVAQPSIWKTIGSLLIVLALIIGGSWLFRRFAGTSEQRFSAAGVEVISRSAISPKQSLCLVKLGPRLLLLGLSPNHMAALHDIDDPEEIAEILGRLEKQKKSSISNTFGRLFRSESLNYPANEDDGYNPDLDPEAGLDDNYERPGRQWYQAKGELTSLLDKVKGLSKIRFKP